MTCHVMFQNFKIWKNKKQFSTHQNEIETLCYTRHNIAVKLLTLGEILLIVAFNTIAHTEIAVDKERQEQSLWMLVNMNVHPFRSRLKFM
jgi:hypothetical protein